MTFLWENLPAICVGAFGLQLVLLVVGVVRDRRSIWPPRDGGRR